MDGHAESPVLPTKEQTNTTLEGHITESEKSLGITSEYDRQLEASLFIDKKFLSYALITDTTQKPERIFGDKAWADYLTGRVFAKEYGKKDLTPEFIRDLHRKLTHHSLPHISGTIRT